MPEYDGSIRINTKITTDNVIPEMRKLQGSLESVGKQAAEVQKRLSALNEAGVNKGAPEYRSEVKEIEHLGESIGELIKRRRELLRQAEINWTGNTDITKDANWQEAFRLLQEAEEKMKAFQAANREYLTMPANPGAQSAVSSLSVAASQAAENLNILKVNIEEYESTLKELQGQGKFFGDEDYDRVYIALQNAKEAAKEYQAQLNSQTYKGQADEAARAAREAEKQAEAQRRIEAEAERNLQRENEKIQRQAEAEAKLDAQRAEEQRINELKDNAIVRDQRIVELAERRRELLKEIKDLERAGVTSGYQDYDIRRQELSAIEQQIRDYGSRNYGTGAKKTKDAFWKVLSSVQKMSESAYKTIGKYFKKFVLAPFKLLKSTAKKSFSQVKKSAKSSNNIFKAGLKNILKYGLGIRSVYILVNKIRTAIKEGFSNYTNAFSDFKDSVNGLKASALTLKNAFASAFAPIVQIAIPYLQQLIVWMTRALNLFAQFTAALTGQNTYRRAVEQTTDAIEAQNKAQNKQLSGLDKLNNLTSDSGSGGKDTSDMFEEVPIDENFKDLAEKTRDVMEKLFKPLKDAWNKEGKFVMDSWKYALDEIKKLAKDIGRDFLEVWQQDKTVAMFEDILHIIGDIGLVIGNLARNFRDAWNENKTGLKIFENIRDILAVIIHNIRLAADYTVEWADKINFQPLLTKIEEWTRSLIPVFDSLSGILTDFYTHVLLPLAKWTLEKGLPDLLQVFIDFNNKVDWEKLRSRLQVFWNHLEPFAETVGAGFIEFVREASDAIANFVNSDTFVNLLDKFEGWLDRIDVDDVADALWGLAAAFVGVKVAVAGFSALSGAVTVFGVLSSAVTGISSAVGLFANLLTTVTAPIVEMFSLWAGGAGTLSESFMTVFGIGGALVGVFAALAAGLGITYANNEEVRTSFDNATSAIKDGLQPAIEFMTGTLLPDLSAGWDRIKDVLKPLADFVSGVFVSIWQDMLNPALTYIGETVLPKATEAFENLWNNVLVPLGSFLSDVLSPVIQIVSDVLTILWENIVVPLADCIGGVLATAFEGLCDIFNETVIPIANIVIETFQFLWDGVLSPLITGLWDNLKPAFEDVFGIIGGIIEGLQQTFSGLIDFITGVFTGDWEQAWNGVKDIFKGIFNGVISILEGAINFAIDGLNSFLQNFNGVVTDIGSVIGIDIQIPQLSKISLPRLATGGITRGSTLANIGEAGREAVLPLENNLGYLDGFAKKIAEKIIDKIKCSTQKTLPYSARNASNFAVSSAMEKLSAMEIPAYANGQVIPRTMKQHLAWLGDNPRETEVVSPLSTIEKAVENVMSKYGNSGITRIEVPVYLNKNEIARAVWDETTRQFKRNGRLPYMT